MSKIKEKLKENGLNYIASEILTKIEDVGLGNIPKSELDLLIYHCIIQNLNKELSDFELMELLKLTPSKLRSLNMNHSIRYNTLSLNDNNKSKLEKTLSRIIKNENLLRFSDNDTKLIFAIDDVHTFLLIERIVSENGGSLSYQNNKKQVVIEYTDFIHLLQIVSNISEKEILKEIKNSLKKHKIENLKFENNSDSIEIFFNKIKENFKEEGIKNIGKIAVNAIFNLLQKRLICEK